MTLNKNDLETIRLVRLRFSYRTIKRQLNEAAGLSARSKKKVNRQPNATEDVETLLKILEKLGY